MRGALRMIAFFLAGVVLVVVVALFAAWPAIETAVAPLVLARATHLDDVRVAGVHDVDGAVDFADVSAQNADGTLTLTVAHLRVLGGPVAALRAAIDPTAPLALALVTPHLVAAEATVERTYAASLATSIRGDAIGLHRVTIDLRDGSLAIGDPAESRSLALTGLHGSLDLTRSSLAIGVVGDERAAPDAAAASPFVLTTSSSSTGEDATTYALRAPSLALAPLASIVPERGLLVRGGFVRRLSLDITTSPGAAPRIAASGVLVHVAGDLDGTSTQPFSEAAARFRVDGPKLVIPNLTARLGRATFSGYGEFDDLPSSGGWLEDGTRQLALVGRTLVAVGRQPDLDAVTADVDAPGIVYVHFHLANPLGPRSISLVAIDPRVRGVRLDTALAEDLIVSGGERTSALGARTSAVAGINGDYFDIGRSYQPQGMLMSDGKLLRSPADRATLAIHRDGSVTFGEYRCGGELRSPQSSLTLSEYNDWPAGYGTVVTRAFGKVLRASPGETFVGLVPVDPVHHAYRVDDVVPSVAEMPVRFGVGIGERDRGALPRPGQLVRLDYRCTPSLDGTVAILGGGPQMLRDGELYDDPHAPAPEEKPVRWPVVALASMEDGTLAMVAVDGRHPERALGMSRPEFAILLQSLGGRDAMALDSGGSVTLVSRRPGDRYPTVRNRPSDDDGERWISDGLFVYSDAPAPATTEGPPVVPDAEGSAGPAPSATPLETIVNPDLPGNGLVTASAPPSAAPGAPAPGPT